MAIMPLTEAFAAIPDPRRAQGRRHPLPGVLALISVAMICGCRSLFAIAQWGRDQGKAMAVQLGLKEQHGTPAVSTLHELMKRLDVAAFETALRKWAESWLPQVDAAAEADGLEPIAVDGKTLRGSHGHELPGVHLLSAYATRLGLVVNQKRATAADDGGELRAITPLLEELVLRGKIVVGDAIFAQRKVCRQILKAQGEYLFVVKANQPTLYRELEDLFRSPTTPLCSMSRRTSMGIGLKPVACT